MGSFGQQTRVWKRIDVGGQVLLLAAAGVVWGLGTTGGGGLFYFGVGGWQAASCIAWGLAMPPSEKCVARRWYERLFILLLVLTAVGVALPAARWPILLFLAATGALTAFWYFFLSLYEVRFGGQQKL